MGDFNAQIGNDNTNLEHFMGKQGIGELKENGELLLELCSNFNLVIGGSLFPHKRIHKITWTSPDQRTENQIDHILFSRKWRRSLLDVRNRRGADVGSDHHLVIGSIKLKIACVKASDSNASRIKFNLRRLASDKGISDFSTSLSEKANKILFNDNLEENWCHVKKALLDTAKDVLGKGNKPRKPWISDTTWNLISERSKVKHQINKSQVIEEKQRLSCLRHSLNKAVKHSARHDKREWKEALAKRAQLAAVHKNSRELYCITKRLANQSITNDYPVKDKHGTIQTSTDKQLSRWHEHFTELLSMPTYNDHLNVTHASPAYRPIRVSTDPPTMDEIVSAIKDLKRNKAAGSDNIPADILKADVTTISRLLHPIMLQIWNTEVLPSEWKTGLIVKLPKKGDLSICDNWRGITLLNACSKIFTKIIYTRIAHTLECSLRQEQAGFRPHRSCVDQINTLRMIIEQSIEWQSSLYLVFVDFVKAFDQIKHAAIWSGLKRRRIPEKIIKMIQLLYSDSSCQILHKGTLSDPISIHTGVKQGCLLSPMLFNIVLDDVMKKVTSNNCGIRWTLHSFLEDLDYADDICLLSHSYTDMEDKLARLITEAETVGLNINIKKTKSLRIFTNIIQPFSIKEELLEEVENFTYLGSVVSKNGGSDEDVRIRINKARHSFGTLRNIWNSAQYATSTKIRIFKSNILPVVLYGCETWKTSKSTLKKLQVFINNCLRRILRIFWPNRVTNTTLWERSNIRPIEQEVKLRKWRWIGHILRRDPNNISRIALDWTPQGNRKRGRPTDTWRRLTLKEATESGKSWRQLKVIAQDRVKWNSQIEALCFR